MQGMKRRPSRTSLYGAFEKVEKQEDGTLIVSGFASTEAKDSDGEIIKADAMAAAIPDYMRWGAVREMHQPSAAGTAIEMQVEPDGRTAFKAHVVDPVAVLKVETEVYKGFSIGGRVVKRDPADRTVITELALTEVSLVDRPANPEAVMKLAKVDGADAAEPIQKGLWSVARLASLLQDVQFLAQDSAWEAESEGDGSAVPAQLRAWLTDGVTILAAMASEEGGEAVENVPAPEPESAVETVELSAPTADLAKVDAPNETPNDVPNDAASIEAMLVKAIDAKDSPLRKALDAAFGADFHAARSRGTMGSILAPTDDTIIVAKAAAPHDDDALAKAIDSAVTKATAPLHDALTQKTETITALEKRLKTLEDQPAPPKGSVRAVTKAEDAGAADPTATTDTPDATDALGLVKAAQSRPMFVAR